MLRAIVDYNVAVINRMAVSVQARRTLEEAELETIESSDESLALADELPAFGSFELGAVEAALSDRLAERPPAADTAGRISATLDLSRLTKFETDAFQTRHSTELAPIVRAVVTIGLLVRHLEELSDDLTTLGLDPEQFRNSAAQKIDGLTRQGVGKLISANKFDEAQSPAEVRSKFLNFNYDENTALLKQAESTQLTPRFDSRKISDRRKKHRGRDRRQVQRKGAQPVKAWSWGSAGVILAIAIAAIFGAYQLVGSSNSSARDYTTRSLLLISHFLINGHERGNGAGSMFVGTFVPSWEGVDLAERVTMGREIEKMLARRGVAEVKFYDETKRLQLHFADGVLRYPEANE